MAKQSEETFHAVVELRLTNIEKKLDSLDKFMKEFRHYPLVEKTVLTFAGIGLTALSVTIIYSVIKTQFPF